jgi:hypothetical protein
MKTWLKYVVGVLAVLGLVALGFAIAYFVQTQPSSVQHDYPLTITVLVSGDFACVLTPSEVTVHKGELATVEITNTVSGGFDAKIMYLVSGLPDGSYSFSVNPVDPGQATTLTIDSSLLASNTVYVCTLTAGDTGELVYEE